MKNEENEQKLNDVDVEENEQKLNDVDVEENDETSKHLPSIVEEIKAQFEGKIEALKGAYGKQIAERDSVIKQLLNGNNTAVEVETIVDKINKKRNFKKW